MAARVTDRLWKVSDLVALLEASERGLERAIAIRDRISECRIILGTSMDSLTP
jgi:hypothetical protein